MEMEIGELRPLGLWTPTSAAPAFEGDDLVARAKRIREVIHIVADPQTGHLGIASGGKVTTGQFAGEPSDYLWMATLPPLYPEWLGNRSFSEVHGTRFPYVAGAMARGIASPEMVVAMASVGMLSFLGTAGLPPEQVERDLDTIDNAVGAEQLPWGANLIHSPNEPHVEEKIVDLYLQRGVETVSASAFMKITLPLVRYACTGLHLDDNGQIQRRNKVVAKVSRTEVARRFMEPPPTKMLQQLVRSGQINEEEARLATHVPVAEDIIAEADSGGHTDGRTLMALLPTLTNLAEDISRERSYSRSIRIGAAGGLGTPTAVASAFALGASFVVTGSINQCSVEARLAPAGKDMLAEAESTDVAVAPSADMFEIGAKVQVLSRGTIFASRANLLGHLYKTYSSLDEIPRQQIEKIERSIFRASIDEIWQETRRFWANEDPSQVEKAENNPHHRMALVFRWYLGKTSRWPIDGTPDRAMDFQIWCGPAMGAFNQWAAGSFLEDRQQRGVVQMALNLLEGAATITRSHQLRTYGVHLPAQSFEFRPTRLR